MAESNVVPIAELWATDSRQAGATGAPRIVALGRSKASTLRLETLSVGVEIHLSVAFVSMTATFKFHGGVRDPRFIFEFPTTPSTTVTSVIVDLPRERSYETLVVEASPSLENFRDREGGGMRAAMEQYQAASGRQIGMFDPDLFSMPFEGLEAGESVTVELSFIEKLALSNGEYVFRLPMTFVEDSVTGGLAALNKIISISAIVNSGISETCCKSNSHPLLRIQPQPEESSNNEVDGNAKSPEPVRVELNKDVPWENTDFEISYTCWEDRVLCRALIERGIVGEREATVSLFLTPPKPSSPEAEIRYSRRAVFILDRSGSMGFTSVMEDAKQALVTGLLELRPSDMFAICAFDHQQFWFSGADPTELQRYAEVQSTHNDEVKPVLSTQDIKSNPIGSKGSPTSPNMEKRETKAEAIKKVDQFFIPATPQNVSRAIEWVQTVHPGGKTDILTPIKQALTGMNLFPDANSGNSIKQQTQLFDESGSVPMLFLFTDGAVENEREICTFLRSVSSKVRTFTFGIGEACNAYFLRKCASIGRGYSDVALLPHMVKDQMSTLISRTALPCLTDITAKFSDSQLEDSAEWYPSRFPDLYIGAPVIASTTFDPEKHPIVSIDSDSIGHLNVTARALTQDEDSSAPSMTEFSEKVEVVHADGVPLRKVFAQQRLENLITETWFVNPESEMGVLARNRCVELAVSERIPSAFTQMVVREGSTADIHARRNMKPTKESTDTVLRATTGAVVFIGAAVVGTAAFGSVAATMALGSAGVGALGVDGAECCEGCDGDCGECCELLASCEGCI